MAADNSRMVKETVDQLGGLDIIIANAGWTRFAKFGDLNDLSDDEWNKVCLASSYHTQVDGGSVGPPTSCAMSSSCVKPDLSSTRTQTVARTSSLRP